MPIVFKHAFGANFGIQNCFTDPVDKMQLNLPLSGKLRMSSKQSKYHRNVLWLFLFHFCLLILKLLHWWSLWMMLALPEGQNFRVLKHAFGDVHLQDKCDKRLSFGHAMSTPTSLMWYASALQKPPLATSWSAAEKLDKKDFSVQLQPGHRIIKRLYLKSHHVG